MGVKSCQCNENKPDNELERVDEIIDNTPYEIISSRKEGIVIKENKLNNCIEQKDNNNMAQNSKYSQGDKNEKIQEPNKASQMIPDKDIIGHNTNLKDNDRFLQQLPDGPPLEIINENNKKHLNDNFNDEEDNDNDCNAENIDCNCDNKQSKGNSPKRSSKTNSLNNTLTQAKDENNNDNYKPTHNQHPQQQLNCQNKLKHQPSSQLKKLQPQKSKEAMYQNTNTNPNNNTLEKQYSITDLISRKKLKQLNDNDIVFTSELDKMINNQDKKAVTYSTRFCVLTPKYFAYYSSKENFLSLTRPLCQLNLSLISNIDKEIGANKWIYFSIMFKLTPETIKLLKNINSFSVMNEEVSDNEEGMIGFKSNNEDIVLKWVALLQYFIQKSKE